MTREEAIKVLEEMSLWKYCEPEAEAAKLAITALREKLRWISVEEILPENNDKVLAFTLSGKYAVARYDQRRRCWIAAGNLTVTHWMPLPDVPEVEV